MSSQGSSRIKTCLGADFEPMLGDPLSREVSMPNTSSIESTPEVTSRLTDRRVSEPVHETTSTLGCPSEEE